MQSDTNEKDADFGMSRTDHTRWRLKDEDGDHTWHYLDEDEAREWPQSIIDKHFLDMPLVQHLNSLHSRC
jgi:hypothetical protein